MNLVMGTFPRLTLLVLGAVPLLMSLLATYETLVVVITTIFRSAFTPAALVFSRESCSSAALSCGLVPVAAIDLAPRRFAICRRLASCVLNYSLVPLLLSNTVDQRVRLMRYEIKTHILVHLAAELEWLDSRRYCFNQHLAML